MSDSPSPRSMPVRPENLPPVSSVASLSLTDSSKPSVSATKTQQESSKPSLSSFIPAWRRPTVSATDPDGKPIRRPSVQFVPHTAKESLHSRSSSAKAPIIRSINLDGSSRTANNGARRLSSPPPPAQFRSSVSFDTFSNPSASEFSLTLNRKHRDYEYTKRSRTFLCGTDTNEYSDTALEWLIDELVDDGDEVVCLRVVETDSKEAQRWSRGQGEKGYQQEAQKFLEAIEKKNTDDRAISLVLEFAIGKVNDTIQHMIRIYEPAILVVGTRGRSLTGYQGLLSSGSVSKYCLQTSPVPVIVVRPSSKREAKKRKRLQDPTRTGYRDILDKSDDAPRGRGGHLLDERHRMSHLSGHIGALGELESDDPAEEARRVAEAIGYRAGHNQRSKDGERRSSSLSRVTNVSTRNDDEGLEQVLKSPDLRNLDSPGASEDEDEISEPEEELGRLYESVRPEDEAALLAYERAQKAAEEEREEAEARVRREHDRSVSHGRGGTGRRTRSRADSKDEEGGGAAVLGLLAQLDRGVIK